MRIPNMNGWRAYRFDVENTYNIDLIDSDCIISWINHRSISTCGKSRVRTNTDVPVDEQVFVPCANNDTGDTIQLSGTAHEVFDVTVDNTGGFHLHENSNGQDITGVSLTTGAEYHAGGGDVSTLNVNGKVGFEQEFSNTFTLIGEGTAANLILHFDGFLTVNPDGTVTANINHEDVQCK